MGYGESIRASCPPFTLWEIGSIIGMLALFFGLVFRRLE
jgi:hypothetical protein